MIVDVVIQGALVGVFTQEAEVPAAATAIGVEGTVFPDL